MSDSYSKRVPLRGSLMAETAAKRRCLHAIDNDSSSIQVMSRPLAALSDPWMPDDIWRMVFQYLDVGHICTRMVVLNRNWSRAAWRVVSAYVPGEQRSGARPAQFKYRPTGYMAQLLRLPTPQYLRTLTLDSVKLTEAEVAPIYQFSGLISLQLVVVRGRAFQNLSRLISLRSLTTWNCEWVNSDVLSHIGRLERLEHLTLNCCDQITDEGLCHLSTLTNLMSLGLTDLTVISEVGLRHLSTLTNLETLTLAFNPVSDEMVKVIAEHHTEKLQVLDLDASSLGEGRITDAGLAVLGKLTKLRRLKLGYHSFTPAGLAGLSGLTNLESLSLESVEGCVTGDSLRSLSKLVHLRKLNLDSCPTFDDSAMAALAHFTELEHLNIAKTMFKRGLSYITSETHPRLTFLDISFSEKLDDAGLKYITQLQNLSTLHLFRCPKGHLTTKGTRALLELKRLEMLDCRECPISKDVARVLRSRIKDFRQDLPISSINLHSGLDDANAPESEELPDSDDESTPQNATIHSTPIVNPTPIHSFASSLALTNDTFGARFRASQSEKTESPTKQTPTGVSSITPTFHLSLSSLPPIQLKDDLNNYQFGDEINETPALDDSDFESEEFEELGDLTDDDEEVDVLRTSRRVAMDVDEVEDHREADDRNLLAAIRSQRTKPQTTPPLPLDSIVGESIGSANQSFDVEELD